MPRTKTSPTPKTTTTPTNRRGRKPKTESNNSSALVPAKPVLDAEIVEDILSPLTPAETSRLAQLEEVIEKSFLQIADALREIHDQKLYRGESGKRTFEEYCEERFGFGKRLGFYYVDAARVVENLKASEQFVHFPTSESQVRALKGLDAEAQRTIWAKAVDKADGVPSARIVEETVKEVTGQRKPKERKAPSFSVGDVGRIRLTSHEELLGKAGYWGIVEEVSNGVVTVALPDRTVSSVPAIDLERVELSAKEKKAREGMMHTLQRIYAVFGTSEKAVTLLINYFETKSDTLSSVDKKLLGLLDREAKSEIDRAEDEPR